MFNLKTLTVITLTIAISALASNASAQMSTQTLEKASEYTLTVKSTEAESRVLPSSQRFTRKVTRIVKPLPALASITQQPHINVHGGTINANASEQRAQGRVIYNRRKDDSITPVYFNKESVDSR